MIVRIPYANNFSESSFNATVSAPISSNTTFALSSAGISSNVPISTSTGSVAAAGRYLEMYGFVVASSDAAAAIPSWPLSVMRCLMLPASSFAFAMAALILSVAFWNLGPGVPSEPFVYSSTSVSNSSSFPLPLPVLVFWFSSSFCCLILSSISLSVAIAFSYSSCLSHFLSSSSRSLIIFCSILLMSSIFVSSLDWREFKCLLIANTCCTGSLLSPMW